MILERCITDPSPPPPDEDEDKVPLEASLHAVPDHAAANCVLLPGAPPVCGEAALRDAVKHIPEMQGQVVLTFKERA